MLEKLAVARDAVEGAREALLAAIEKASPLEYIIIMPMLERASLLVRDIDELRRAVDKAD